MAAIDLSERRKDLLASMMKEVIFEAAVAVLTQYGWGGVTMDRVAERAGVAKGSLYNYFPNKQALLQFVHERTVEPMKQTSAEILLYEMPANTKLEAVIRLWYESIAQQRGVFSLFFTDFSVRALLRSEETTGRDYAIELTSAIIRQGIEEGIFRYVDAERTAGMLFGVARETCERQLPTDSHWPIDRLVDEVMDFFLHGVAVAE